MGKRYYCDYCDRSFKDDSEARKKHLTSLVHVNKRSEHYNFFKEPEEILKEETSKITCKKFSQSGECQFGNNCRFSHYTGPMIWELRQLVAMKKEAELNTRLSWPNPNEIVKEFFEDITDDNENNKIEEPAWNVPLEIKNYPNLPPSLWAITSETIIHPDCGKWGF